MKTSKNQKIVIAELQGILKDFELSNDINSPSHYSLIDNSIDELQENGLIDNPLKDKLEMAILDLLIIIRRVKK